MSLFLIDEHILSFDIILHPVLLCLQRIILLSVVVAPTFEPGTVEYRSVLKLLFVDGGQVPTSEA